MNWRRLMYTVMGLVIVIQSVLLKDWLPALLGGYFAAMGIFGFGCASGACGVAQSRYQQSSMEDTHYEEVK